MMRAAVKRTIPVPLLMSNAFAPTTSNKTGLWSPTQPRYQNKTAPCSVHCPCGQDIPLVEMLVARRRFRDAWRVLLSENPFPGVCGRVCFHPCERGCNRGHFDAPVSIHALERFLDDEAWSKGYEERIPTSPPSGKRIAVIGSGPAGLAAAFFLSRLGHACDVLEAESHAGGLLRYGIPSYRLPLEALEREIKRIEALGVRILCSHRVDVDFLSQLRQSYDALFISCGKGCSKRLGIPGEELAIDGLCFLKQSMQSGSKSAEKAVVPLTSSSTAAVIGGGNSAMDVARSLLRLGVSPIIVYRRRREDMPAFSDEIHRASAEGVQIMELSAPLSITAGQSGLTLQIQRMRINGMGPDGRMRVAPIPGDTSLLQVDQIYAAIGADAAEPWMIPPPYADRLSLSHSVSVLESANNLPTVYGGDSVNKEESVADAIASGKEAAIILDAYFKGGSASVGPAVERCRIGDGRALSMEIYRNGLRGQRSERVVEFADLNPAYFDHAEPGRGEVIPPALSIGSFAEIEKTLDLEEAVRQAERCFQCGLCNDCDNCRTFCPEVAVLIKAEEGSQPDSAINSWQRWIDADFCKGCGICVTECPRSAMVLEEPSS